MALGFNYKDYNLVNIDAQNNDFIEALDNSGPHDRMITRLHDRMIA